MAAGPVAYLLRDGPRLPKPTGTYPIGRLRLALIDQQRPELFTPAPTDQRAIVLTIFYPAQAGDQMPPGPYTAARNWQLVNGAPAFLLNLVTPRFVDKAPAADRAFPLLLFGAGFGGPITYYTSLIEEIVSHGYVVLAVEHPYHFSTVYFPDGHVIYANDFGANEGIYDTEADKIALSALLVDDLRFALDAAERLNREDAHLAGRFDLTRIGAFGHSFGGQTAAALGLIDARVKAVINFDGSIVDPRVIEHGVPVPYLHLFDAFGPPPPATLAQQGRTVTNWWADFRARNYPASLRTGQAPFHVVQMIGAAHYSFATDLPLLRPLFPLLITDDLIGEFQDDGPLRAVSALTLAFFDVYLNGGRSTNAALAAHHPLLYPGFDTTGWGITVEQ